MRSCDSVAKFTTTFFKDASKSLDVDCNESPIPFKGVDNATADLLSSLTICLASVLNSFCRFSFLKFS